MITVISSQYICVWRGENDGSRDLNCVSSFPKWGLGARKVHARRRGIPLLLLMLCFLFPAGIEMVASLSLSLALLYLERCWGDTAPPGKRARAVGPQEGEAGSPPKFHKVER